jgi:hypothetical protein
MARRAADPAFVRSQIVNLSEPHIKPITELVDELIAERPGSWMPYVAPYHGGVESEILLLFQDPGKMTSRERGSGMIGCENDDPSAERLAKCLAAAGLKPGQVMPWNAYPWYRENQGPRPSATELDQGTGPLLRLLGLLPNVHTVVAFGGSAQDGWKRFLKRYPREASPYRYLETRHTSSLGITNGSRTTAQEGVERVVETLIQARQPTGRDA